MADTESDLDLFGEMFGAFELYVDQSLEDSEIDDGRFSPSPEIQSLLALTDAELIKASQECRDAEPETLTAVPLQPVQVSNLAESEAEEKIFDQALPVTAALITQEPETTPTRDELIVTKAENSRFKSLSKEQLEEISEKRYSEATKSNTKWAVNLFQEWCVERQGEKANLSTITADNLNSLLKQFYAEAQPRMTESRKRKFSSEEVSQEYHRNSMRNVRAGINRHFKETNRKMDIVRDGLFQEANYMLEAKLKSNLKSGLNLPTKHKPVIIPNHLKAINTYLKGNNPVILRYRVWYVLSIQYVSRGLEFHPQFKRNSLELHQDETGREFYQLAHELKEKQQQEGVTNEKRMYATEDSTNCPVKTIKQFLSKCHPDAEKLFCHIDKKALESPETSDVWYTRKPVSTRQFTSFMSDICRNADIDTRYTAHSLRATATQALNDAGCELRHIMFMTGHRNEASVRSYSRQTTDAQKYKLSSILTDLSVGQPSVEGQNPELATTAAGAATTPSTLAQVQPPMEQKPSSSATPQGFNPAQCTFNNCHFVLGPK